MASSSGVDPSAPVLDFESLGRWREQLRDAGGRLVFTNGCFDVLHAGHVRYLQQARSFGDCLLVALNSDASVAALKGPGRPVNPAADRCAVLCGLRAVDAVTVFAGTRATAVIREIRPDIYVKGGDYALETLDPGERRALQDCGAEIRLVPLLEGRSTTRLLQKIAGA